MISLMGCSGGGGDAGELPGPPETFSANFTIGDVVAEFELAAPSEATFILRGTVPLPPGMYLPGSTFSPFILRSAGTGTSPTQVEVVSRYPAPSDGADVVEVIARVTVPAGSNPGDRITYSMIWSPVATGVQTLDSEVETLLETAGSLRLRATDVFGHQYQADVLKDRRENSSDLRTLRDGQIAHQVRTYENLMPDTPVAGSTGTLPHMMGVHAYVTTWDSEAFFSVDLRFHNGHEGFLEGDTQDDPVGKLYFNELELVIPSGWNVFQAFETPSSGTQYTEGPREVYPLVKPIGGTQLHMMPIQAQFHRRLVVCRDGSEARARSLLAEEGLAFCTDGTNANDERLMSWWNPGTARYWGQNLPLPTLTHLNSKQNIRADLSGRFDTFEAAITGGTPGPWPNMIENLGWAHPAGLNIGYAYGGHHIYWWDGLEATWSASTEGYRSFQILHRMYSERHTTALYAANGDAYQMEKWVVQGANGPYLPTYLWTVPFLALGDPHGFTTAPTFQIDAVELQGRKPDYEADLLNYQWIDTSHLIRYTRSPKVLAWVGNDAIAKDDLRMQAEISRSTWAPYPQTESGETIMTGMQRDLEYVAEHPNDGISMERGEGWIMDTAASYYALADPAWRSTALPWFKTLTDLLQDGQSGCNGVIMSLPHDFHLGGNYRLLQSISEAIIQNGLWSIRSSVFAGQESAYETVAGNVLRTSVTGMTTPRFWDAAESSFRFYTALGPFDRELPSFCSYVPDDGYAGHDGWQTWNVLVFGYLLTGSQGFLNKAAMMGGGTLTEGAIGADTWAGELEVRAGMVSLIQNYL